MQKPTQTESTLPTLQGLVVSYHGSSVSVEAASGQVFQCHLRRNQTLPVVGDWVDYEMMPDHTGIVTRILPRKSELTRGHDKNGKAKVIAANVDILLIVMTPPPNLSEYLLDRYVIAAELLGIEPIIVMNKKDLLAEVDVEQVMSRLAVYQAIPYQVLMTSARTQEGLSALRTLLKDKTAVLVGPSGVGKSSLIAALTKEAIVVQNVSTKGTGKHTTTATRLYHLPEGGHLIDSPGVREFKLWSVNPDTILKGFKEFLPFLTGCQFRDCRHVAEPGCAVQAALACGKISPQRYAHFQMLTKEAKLNEKSYK